MSEEVETTTTSTEPEDLKPKKPSKRAPEGIRTFTVCRQNDETGIAGEGVVIEGAMFATGHTVIHWLTPAPRGSIAFFDAFDDFESLAFLNFVDGIDNFCNSSNQKNIPQIQIIEIIEQNQK